MKNLNLFLWAIGWLTFGNALPANATTVRFRLDSSTQVTVTATDSNIRYRTQGAIESRGTIPLDIEKPVHLELADYNFDGTKDFSIWYADEGMGVSKIYRIFIYSKLRKRFVEQRPLCGDEFINLKVDVQHRYLQSTYFDDNVPKICITRLPKVVD